jgi:general secretion pathway protein L
VIGRQIVGLDIGSYSVKVTHLVGGLRGVELVRNEQFVIPLTDDPAECDQAIREFLGRLALPRDHVVAALPANRVTQRHVRLPFVGEKRVVQATRFEISENLPFPLEEALMVCEQVPSSPGQTAVLAVVATREEVGAVLDRVRAVFGEPRVLETEGAVLGNLSSAWSFSDSGRVLMDIGHSKTTICLLLDGRPIVLRTIPVAGRHFTEALATAMNCDFATAERHKHEFGLFDPATHQPECSGVRDLLERVVHETLRTIHSVAGDPLAPIAPDEVILVGGTATVVGLPSYLEAQLGLPCQALGAPPESAGLEPISSAIAPVFAESLALALRVAPSTRVTSSDFRQQEFRYTPDLSGTLGQLQFAAALFGVALVLWVAGLGAQYAVATGRLNRVVAQQQEIFKQAFPERAPPANPLATIRRELRSTREVASLLGVTGSGQSVLDVIRAISEKVPRSIDVVLTDLRITQTSVKAKGTTRSYQSVDALREKLLLIESFESVALTNVVKTKRPVGHAFDLTITLQGASE